MRDEDAELCRAAREGDHDAASQLVSRHYKRIYAYFARLAPPDDAEDLTQRTFSKVWEALASFSGKSSFSTWVHGIAHHVYVDWRRKRNLLDPQPLEWWDSCSAETPSPFESAAERDEVLCLYRWVDQLDADSRELVHLHYYQGLTLRELSEALQIATSTVKYRLRQAIDQLHARAAAAPLQSFR